MKVLPPSKDQIAPGCFLLGSVFRSKMLVCLIEVFISILVESITIQFLAIFELDFKKETYGFSIRVKGLSDAKAEAEKDFQWLLKCLGRLSSEMKSV